MFQLQRQFCLFSLLKNSIEEDDMPIGMDGSLLTHIVQLEQFNERLPHSAFYKEASIKNSPEITLELFRMSQYLT